MYSTLLHIYICSVMYPSADIYFWFEFINVVLRIVILAKFNMICFNRNASVIMATNQFLLLLFRLLFSQQSRITSNGTSRKCSIVLTGRNTSSMISVGHLSIYIWHNSTRWISKRRRIDNFNIFLYVVTFLLFLVNF